MTTMNLHHIAYPPSRHIEIGTNWKQHSADLFRMYGHQGLISPSQFSIEGWNLSNYTMRSNGNEKGQKLRFTSIFTCPISGMQFPSGKMKSVKAVEKDGVYWYKTNRQAMQAAAANAIDCLSMQGNQSYDW
mmetsp:Transcript_31500/g.57065  ORF Transcript_31500/g.57065 Transcript_31500/m.57065 type:complete len:131 (+) Transcript_31500:176-568(+)